MNRAVFLDRDGVINRGVREDGTLYAPMSREAVELLPGVPDALDALHGAGFLLIVVTNQPDVARKTATRAEVDAVHAFLRTRLPALDEIRTCFHDDADHCACRKPQPGMIFAAAVDHEVDLSRSFMVGDRWRDIAAGRSAGCRTIQVNAVRETIRVTPDVELPDLPSCVEWIRKARERA